MLLSTNLNDLTIYQNLVFHEFENQFPIGIEYIKSLTYKLYFKVPFHSSDILLVNPILACGSTFILSKSQLSISDSDKVSKNITTTILKIIDNVIHV